MTELEERVQALEAELAAASDDDTLDIAALLGRLGTSRDAIGERARAREVLRQSVALYEEHGFLDDAADSLNCFGAVLAMEHPEQARALLARALRHARSSFDPSAEATSLNNLAMIDEESGDLDLAHERYTRSIELLRIVGDRRKLATTLSNLGVVEDKAGHDDVARDLWREALALHEEVGYEAGIASTLNNMGGLLERGGEASLAVENYLRGIEIQERQGDKGELIILLANLAKAYATLGQRGPAIEARRRVIAIYESIGDKPGMGRARHRLAIVLDADGQLAEANDNYAGAPLVAALPAGAEVIELAALPVLITALARLGRHADARDRLVRIDELASVHGTAEDRALCATLRELVRDASSNDLMGQISAANDEVRDTGPAGLEQLVETAIGRDQPLLAVSALVFLGRHYQATGSVELARDRLIRASTLLVDDTARPWRIEIEKLLVRLDFP